MAFVFLISKWLSPLLVFLNLTMRLAKLTSLSNFNMLCQSPVLSQNLREGFEDGREINSLD
jgi:hypothetical protein